MVASLFSLAVAGTAPPPPSYSAEATALFLRMPSQPTDPQKTAMDNYIVALKSSGTWAKLDALYVPAVHARTSAVLNWVGTNYNLVENGTLAWATSGYTGGGTIADYLDTQFNPTTAVTPFFAQDLGALGVYCNTNVSSNVMYDIGSSNSFICSLSGALAARIRPNMSSNMAYTIPSTTSVGMTSWTRTDAANFTAYKDGANSSTQAQPSAALNNSTFLLCAAHSTGTVINPSTRQIQMGFIGGNLSGADHSAINAAHVAYKAAMGI